jgi:hypothetical protein
VPIFFYTLCHLDFLSDDEVIEQAQESPIADKETVAFSFSKWELA